MALIALFIRLLSRLSWLSAYLWLLFMLFILTNIGDPSRRSQIRFSITAFYVKIWHSHFQPSSWNTVTGLLLKLGSLVTCSYYRLSHSLVNFYCSTTVYDVVLYCSMFEPFKQDIEQIIDQILLICWLLDCWPSAYHVIFGYHPWYCIICPSHYCLTYEFSLIKHAFDCSSSLLSPTCTATNVCIEKLSSKLNQSNLDMRSYHHPPYF